MGFENPLVGWGIPGFIISVLAGVIIYQNKVIQRLYAEKNDIQELRIDRSREMLEKYLAAMGDFSQTAKLLLAKLDGEAKR